MQNRQQFKMVLQKGIREMVKFEVLNELTLKVTMDANESIHTKAGAMIGFQGDVKFDKELLGPGNNVVGQVLGQLARRFTGENLPLMKSSARCLSECYFANEAQHVVILNLNAGERIAVESESILAFTSNCQYGVMFLPLGAVSQRGLATSTITGPGQAAVLVDGNPIVLRGQCVVDPDAMVAFTGSQPSLGLDINWKNIIGQASGESYNMKFNDPGNIVIIQPNERKSGLDISMDGRRTGSRPASQSNMSVGGAVQETGNAIGGAGDVLSHVGGMLGGGSTAGSGSQGGLGGILGNLLR